MYIIHSSLDKQTTATQESDTRDVNCSGNSPYVNVDMKSDGFKNQEGGTENNYEYLAL